MKKKQLNEKNLSYDLFKHLEIVFMNIFSKKKTQHRQSKRLATRTHQTSGENQGTRDG